VESDRRVFIKSGVVTTAAVLATRRRVLGAGERVRLAIIGLHGRGYDHVRGFSRVSGVEIVAICDVDENVLAKRVADMESLGLPRPRTFVDVRKLLESPDIDAVSIATPNHWHSLISIWAMQAGKDVYCEKPCSHNWWEGDQLVAAVKRYNRIWQHGTQSRSSASVRDAVQRMGDGLIGNVYLSRGLCFKWRDTIGHTPIEPVPAGVHYDLWTGPAPLRPFTRNRFHYNWHWFWDTGNGDLGNQGIHELDVARWGLGVGFPTRVSAVGGHFMFRDDQQTPNTLNVACEFDNPDGSRRMLEFEVRHWITNHEAGIGTGAYRSHGVPKAGLAKPAAPKAGRPKLGPDAGAHNTIGNIFYGSKGYLGIEGYDSYKSWLGEDMEPGPEARGGNDLAHYQNFIDCVRSRNAADLHAPVEEAHMSCTLVHLANASYRVGRSLRFDPAAQQVIDDPEADALLRGTYREPFVVPVEI
jgi:predicted dehydrogenase